MTNHNITIEKMKNSDKWKLMKINSDKNEFQQSQDEFERIWYPFMGPSD